VLLSQCVRNDDQEELDDGLTSVLFSTHRGDTLLAHASAGLAKVDIVAEVRVNGVLEVLNR
jgi:hypothetical protein